MAISTVAQQEFLDFVSAEVADPTIIDSDRVIDYAKKKRAAQAEVENNKAEVATLTTGKEEELAQIDTDYKAAIAAWETKWADESFDTQIIANV